MTGRSAHDAPRSSGSGFRQGNNSLHPRGWTGSSVIHGLREPSMVEDRFLKRLRKKARKGLRGWPIATVAFYGPNLSQATKVTVGIVPAENAEGEELRHWKVDQGEIRADPGIAREILELIANRRVIKVAMTDGII